MKITYPAELPISAHRDELVDLIRANQVVVVAGETGSGKSTQLPKICMDAGYGTDGRIGHTQPRRIAARSVATRVAEELGVSLGSTVGYTVRFDDRTANNTRVKVMTDGILLAEMVRDRNLSAYDAIIVDEAHERSLNIDFLLGYLHHLIARRPELRLIITSATIDTDKIAAHFGNAPVVEVSGRTWPVEVRYRPREDTAASQTPAAVRRAVDELIGEGPGDILVFSSGEREIHEICDHLGRHEPDIEVLPLYARLSTGDQQRVFRPGKRRRVIVSTNVAETSLTVPGIRYVIDLGEARMSRFSQRTKVQRLPIEAISQASANQRSGRCGRLGPGVAIRLYAEDDFDSRPEFTEPEIQRTNLASVILTMADLRLGSPLEFGFIDPPADQVVADGARLLHELDAVESPSLPANRRERDWLTPIGRHLARMPIDPRLGAMVLAGEHEGCLREAIVVAAGLAVQDPRERPPDRRARADEAHSQFADPNSDIMSILWLWQAAQESRRELSRNRFRRWCRDRFLHAQRIIEWLDIIEQLREWCDRSGLAMSYSSMIDLEGGPDATVDGAADLHRAVLAGSLSQIGTRVERSHEYLGPRNARFAIQPGSVCFETKPPWIMATSLVETTRLWARGVAPIDPGWVEEPAAHLTTLETTEALWNPKSARAMTTETVRLFGLAIISGRDAPLDRHDPGMARDMFIHHALILGETDRLDDLWGSTRATNESVRREARNLWGRSDRRSFDDEYDRVWAFYDRVLPATVTSGAHFASWYRPAHAENPHVLEMSIDDLVEPDELEIDHASFPEQVTHGDVALNLDYQDETAAIAVDIPLAAVGQIDPKSFVGIVPGHRRDAVIALVRALPKAQRKKLVPVPESVDRLLAQISANGSDETAGAAGATGTTEAAETAGAAGGFAAALRSALEREIDEPLPAAALDPRTLPDGLRPHYRVIGPDGEPIAHGSNLAALTDLLADQMSQALDAGAAGISHRGATDWDFATIPDRITVETPQGPTPAYPGLVDQGETVGVKLHSTRQDQSACHRLGTMRLLRLTVAAPLREMNAVFDPGRVQALIYTPHGDRKAWFEDLNLAALAHLVDSAPPVRTADGFAKLQRRARNELGPLARKWAPIAAEISDLTARIRLALVRAERLPATSVLDARDHLDRLTYPGHFSGVGLDRFDDLVRYLTGLAHRLDKLAERPGADRAGMEQLNSIESRFDAAVDGRGMTPDLEAIAWSIEELRVSVFAQHLGTAERVSAARIRKRLSAR